MASPPLQAAYRTRDRGGKDFSCSGAWRGRIARRRTATATMARRPAGPRSLGGEGPGMKLGMATNRLGPGTGRPTKGGEDELEADRSRSGPGRLCSADRLRALAVWLRRALRAGPRERGDDPAVHRPDDRAL